VPAERGVAHWSEYVESDAAVHEAPPPGEFPTLRVRGPLAVVGLCSALPTPLFHAVGRVGATQLARLGPLLERLGRAGLFRLVLIHHPPESGVVSRRRELRDAPQLRDVLARAGAELVLHGHTHRARVGSLPGPDGSIPVVGARSASDVGLRPGRRAQYHLYELEPRAAAGAAGAHFGIRMRVRGYYPEAGGFAAEDERSL
jgi:3',5'-cyclic AMP phosphodiesterase CpdA